ncbi:MAG: hypothetical protein O7J95_06525 [Planctomycetota bacterium]|nr:hypothetical protein [Planctomycetota bacterium]
MSRWRDTALRGPGCVARCSAAVFFLGGCVTDHGPIPWERWRGSYPEDYSLPLESKALAIERHLVERHLSPEGVLVYHRVDRPFDPGAPGAYSNLSDEPIWSGALAAALAFKFKVTGDPRDRALLVRSLEGLRFLQEVTGVPGLLARAIAPRAQPIPGERPEEEWRDAPAPHEAYRYRGDVSRDQYFGVLLGYAATAVELEVAAGRGDEELRRLLEEPACAIADHFWRNDLRIVDADGETTLHGWLGGYFLGVPLGPNAGLVLGFQLLAHRLSGERRYLENYRQLIARQYHKATTLIKFEILGRTNHNNDNMGMMALYALTHLETEPEILETYEDSLEKLWHHLRHEGNAFFHLVRGARAALPLFARFDLRENLRLFPVDPRAYPVDLRGDSRVEVDCFRNRFGILKNRTALPMHVRWRGSFVWKNCPYALVREVPDPGDTTYSGVDFLLAYWMARVSIGDPESLPEARIEPER